MSRWTHVKKNIEDRGKGPKKGAAKPSDMANRWSIIDRDSLSGNASSSGGSRGFMNIPEERDLRPRRTAENSGSSFGIFEQRRRNAAMSSSDSSRTPTQGIVPGNTSPSQSIFGGNEASSTIDNIQRANNRSLLSIHNIRLLFVFIVLAVILATATMVLIAFFSTPAGRTVSVLAVLVIFIWMKKKGWLPF